MPEPMSPEAINDIAARLKAVDEFNPLPWTSEYDSFGVEINFGPTFKIEDANGDLVFATDSIQDLADLLRHAPADIRRLLDENARLNAELESLRVHNGVLVTEIYHQAARADSFREERDALVVQHQADLAARRTAEEHLRRDVVEIDEEREALAAKLDAVRAAAREIHEPMRLWPTREDPMGEAQECMACREPFPCDTIRALDAAPEMPRPPAEEAPTHFAPYGHAATSCGETIPKRMPWNFAAADWDSPAITTRRAMATCVLCLAVFRNASESANGATQPGAGDTDTSGTGSGRGTGVAEASGTAQESEWPDVDGWTIHAGLDGDVSIGHHPSGSLLTGKDIPLGAVLAFIADLSSLPVPSTEPLPTTRTNPKEPDQWPTDSRKPPKT